MEDEEITVKSECEKMEPACAGQVSRFGLKSVENGMLGDQLSAFRKQQTNQLKLFRRQPCTPPAVQTPQIILQHAV